MNCYEEIPSLKRPPDIFDLTHRVGIIIGGAGKMGRQFATTLGYAGAIVNIADVNLNESRRAANEIADLTKATVRGMKCDVTDEKQILNLFKDVISTYQRIDFLIYNVMAKPEGYYSSCAEYSLNSWNEVIHGNLTGAFLCCREAERYMRDRNGGSIVLTSSTYGLVGPDQRIYENCSPAYNIYGASDPLNCPAPYSASKAGLIGLARYFSTLWGRDNIRVNVLSPGGVFDGQEKSFHEQYVKRTPLGRMAVWSDYNGAILFLTSDASRYMTGANLVIDGGWTAW